MKTKLMMTVVSALLSAAALAKTLVDPPILDSKAYTGSTQAADVPDSVFYEVIANFGGSSVGKYSVYLRLRDAANCEWIPIEGVVIEGDVAQTSFEITKAANEWLVEPSMSGWTWGEAVPTPVGKAKFGQPGLLFNGKTAAGETVTGATSITAAGEYMAVFTVAETENYSGLSKSVPVSVGVGKINVDPDDPTEPKLWASGYEGAYDGEGHSISVSVSDSGGGVFMISYSQGENGPFVAEKPAYTNAGTHTVWYKVSSSSYAEYTSSLTVRITKAMVDAPTLAAKAYTGLKQVADVPESGLYDVVANFGGVGVGRYSVYLQLTDPENHGWSPAEGVAIEGDVAQTSFEITKAANEWLVEPSMSGWTWGEAVPTPVAEAKFGQPPTLLFDGETADGEKVTGATSILAVGEYEAIFTVAETADYAGLEKRVPFSVKTGKINIDPDDPTEPKLWVSGFEGVYDGTGHSIDVTISGTGSELFVIEYAGSPEGPFAPAPVEKTNVCDEAVWYRIVSRNFAVITNSAPILVTNRCVTLFSPTKTKDFDGEPLTFAADEIEVGGAGYAEDESFEFSDFAAIVDEGSTDATFAYAAGPGTLLSNYEVSIVTGLLTVVHAVPPEPTDWEMIPTESPCGEYGFVDGHVMAVTNPPNIRFDLDTLQWKLGFIVKWPGGPGRDTLPEDARIRLSPASTGEVSVRDILEGGVGREFLTATTNRRGFVETVTWEVTIWPEDVYRAHAREGASELRYVMTASADAAALCPEGLAETDFTLCVPLGNLELVDINGYRVYPVHLHTWDVRVIDGCGIQAMCVSDPRYECECDYPKGEIQTLELDGNGELVNADEFHWKTGAYVGEVVKEGGFAEVRVIFMGADDLVLRRQIASVAQGTVPLAFGGLSVGEDLSFRIRPRTSGLLQATMLTKEAVAASLLSTTDLSKGFTVPVSASRISIDEKTGFIRVSRDPKKPCEFFKLILQ